MPRQAQAPLPATSRPRIRLLRRHNPSVLILASGAMLSLLMLGAALAREGTRGAQARPARIAEPIFQATPLLVESVHNAARITPDSAAAAPPPQAPAWAVHPMIFNGRVLRPVRTIRMKVTAYCPCRLCCGSRAHGITASGMSVYTNGMDLVAADTHVLPFWSLVSIPGYAHGRAVPVLDRGSQVKGNHLDILMPTHAQAMAWGVHYLEVTVWTYAD